MSRHNQTESAWLEGLADDAKGTAILYFDGQPVPKEFVENVTYARAKELGASASVFKWVPDDVESCDDMVLEGCSPFKRRREPDA